MGSLFSSHIKKNKDDNGKYSKDSKAPKNDINNEKDLAVLDLKNCRDRLKKFRKKVLII